LYQQAFSKSVLVKCVLSLCVLPHIRMVVGAENGSKDRVFHQSFVFTVSMFLSRQIPQSKVECSPTRSYILPILFNDSITITPVFMFRD
jgi:hypothetical protein